MSRDASGNYSLPSGNPVVTATTITSTWANATMPDIGTELTSSLDRSGRGGMLANLAMGGFNITNTGTIRLTSVVDVTLASTTHAFQIGLDANANLCISDGIIQVRNNGAASVLDLNPLGGAVKIGTLTQSGTNTGDQTITLTGDVTGSGTGSFAASIGANKVTLTHMATIATASILGRVTAATGNVEVLTAANVWTIIGSTRTLTSGGGLTGGGDLSADRTLAVGAGTGIVVNADDVAVSRDHTATTSSVGYLGIPQNSQSVNYTTVAADAGKHLYHPSGGGAGDTYTIDSNANVPYAIGTAISFINGDSNSISIAITTDTLTLAGTTTTGTRTLAQNGVATAVKVTATLWIISGTGLT